PVTSTIDFANFQDSVFGHFRKCWAISSPCVSWLIRQSPFCCVYVWVFLSISILGYMGLHIWLHGFLSWLGAFLVD
ncbi:MAG: hypothetical protein OXJ52_09695, partial [Oligoflexia bacterium]|nr:hypothetical protein [Oligoflexia bacterium]